MDAPAGSTPASELPKSLNNILDVLMKENGLQSWQIFSQKRGVSLILKFGETQNGGQSIKCGNNKTAYSKKSPSQTRSDEKRSQERRITRQQARIANKKDVSEIEVENPRGEFKDIINSPSHNYAWSPIPVDIHDTPHISGIISRSSLADQCGYSHVDQ